MCDLNFQAWILCEISRSEVMRCTPSVLQPLIDFICGQASLFAPDSIVAVWLFFFFYARLVFDLQIGHAL